MWAYFIIFQINCRPQVMLRLPADSDATEWKGLDMVEEMREEVGYRASNCRDATPSRGGNTGTLDPRNQIKLYICKYLPPPQLLILLRPQDRYPITQTLASTTIFHHWIKKRIGSETYAIFASIPFF